MALRLEDEGEGMGWAKLIDFFFGGGGLKGVPCKLSEK